MSDTRTKEWVANWKKLTKLLEDQRNQDIKDSDIAKNIQSLDWAYRYNKLNQKEIAVSGMVEFYKILASR